MKEEKSLWAGILRKLGYAVNESEDEIADIEATETGDATTFTFDHWNGEEPSTETETKTSYDDCVGIGTLIEETTETTEQDQTPTPDVVEEARKLLEESNALATNETEKEPLIETVEVVVTTVPKIDSIEVVVTPTPETEPTEVVDAPAREPEPTEVADAPAPKKRGGRPKGSKTKKDQ